MPPNVDLVITIRITGASKSHSKTRSHEEARKAECQYATLLDTLSQAGLYSTGRRGENHNHILLLVSCPQHVLSRLVKRERHSDFLYGLPTASIPVVAADFEIKALSPADRLRIVYSYITSTAADGGLGIHPGSPNWEFIESVMVLHDRVFNDTWIRSWTTHRITPAQFEKIREQFGDAVALYFVFLSSYTKALIFPAVLGVIFHFFGTPYSPVFSTLLVLWSVGFVEWWRALERVIAMRNGTSGSFRVEKHRAHHIAGFPWWKRELRMAASIPVILLFVVVLVALLTGIFIFEAFVTCLYTGPGHKYISFSPTILFVVFVPRLLALYQASAVRFTDWENHAHQSTHDTSLTLKTFALSAVEAYLGLALSAFVYVPFGEGLMHLIQVRLFEGANVVGSVTTISTGLNETILQKTNGSPKIWDTDRSRARSKLSSSRLRDQMFAFTVTNQVVNAFSEIGLPFILRGIESFRGGKRLLSSPGKKKRVLFEDEAKGEREGKEEREFLENIRREVALPEYTLFEDYSEMVTQFGYVALWSTIWPLAAVMSLLNNVLELRSDAIKIAVHHRRPIPTRTDTIGPWLESLTFLTWLSALTNSALVYLYRPRAGVESLVHQTLFGSSSEAETADSFSARRKMLVSAFLIALVASHGYILVRGVVRHLVNRAMWTESSEVAEAARSEKAVKESYLRNLGGNEAESDGNDVGFEDEKAAFWMHDEGMEEIQKFMKEE